MVRMLDKADVMAGVVVEQEKVEPGRFPDVS
jgi:hypothetical protein